MTSMGIKIHEEQPHPQGRLEWGEISICLSISLTPCPLTGTYLKGVATAELSPGLPVQALSQRIPDLFHPFSLSPVLFHSIYPLHWWFPPYSPSLNPALILYLFCRYTHSFSSHVHTTSVCFASPIQPLRSPFPVLFCSY